MPSRAARAVALVALAIVAACGPVPDMQESPVRSVASTPELPIESGEAQPSERLWGPLAVVPPQGGSDSARTEGVLEITASCVVLNAAGGPVLILWPADRTAWTAEQQSVEFTNPDGVVATAGDGAVVVLGGSGDSNDETGTTTEAWLARTPWVVPPHDTCPLEERWWVGSLEMDR
jgi:hypothetical protein